MVADEVNPEAEGGPRPLRATIGGRYQIDLDAPLGAGGMSLVYVGLDLKTRQPVAVKTLRLEYRQDPETRARFRREARLLAFLNHPNVVRVLAVVEERTAPWVVLERAPGRTVRELLDERGPFSPEEVVPILEQTAAALGHLHARGFVHLDVKPQNLLVAADGTLKVVDFGLAQPADRPQEAMGGRTFGTVAYLAPEQASGEPVDAATDIYALGCVVYELLTGAPPFAAMPVEHANDAIRARLERPPAPPSSVRPDLRLPRWVDDVVLWALARNPAARYGDAASFARLFRSWVEGARTADLPPARNAAQVPMAPGVGASRRQEVATAPSGPVSMPFGSVGANGGSTGEEVAGSSRRWPDVDLDRLVRWLWVACALLLVANVLLGAFVVGTQGRVPGIYEPAGRFEPGATALVASDGAIVRAAASGDAGEVAGLAPGTRLVLAAPPVELGGVRWWQVRGDVDGRALAGFAKESELRPPPPPAPFDRLRAVLGR